MIVPIMQEARIVKDIVQSYVLSNFPEASPFISENQYFDFAVSIVKALKDAKIIPDPTPKPRS